MANTSNSKKNNFILQAGVLAAAGMISRVIGLLYIVPLTNIVGELSIGYYKSAYTIYTTILLISSYSIPSAISKVIAQKLAVKEYRNAHRIFLCSLWYVLAVGAAASLFLFLGAGLLTEGAAVTVLRVFAPTVFLYGLLGVLRGYFQAHKSMLQTSVSQILEQIINAVVSVGAAYGFIRVFMGTLEETGDAAFVTKRAMYGAIGSAMGTGAGVLAGLLFMWAVYGLNRGLIRRRMKRDRNEYLESYGDISRMIVGVVTPFILSTAVYNMSAMVNNMVYTKLLIYGKGIAEETVFFNYGIFAGQAVSISNIPIAFASAMASAMIPSIAGLVAVKDLAGAREKIGMAVKSTMLITIPCAIGLLVLAKPITMLLFRREEDVVTYSSRLLMALAISVIFYALSTLSSSILQGMGKVNTPIINAGIALLVQTVVVVVLLYFTKLDLYALAIANTCYSGIMCLLNQISVRKAVGYRQEMYRSFFLPLLASGFMGAMAWAVYEGLYLLTDSNTVALFPAIILGGCVYFALLIAFRGVTESELRKMPKGYLLVKAARKCRLIK